MEVLFFGAAFQARGLKTVGVCNIRKSDGTIGTITDHGGSIAIDPSRYKGMCAAGFLHHLVHDIGVRAIAKTGSEASSHCRVPQDAILDIVKKLELAVSADECQFFGWDHAAFVEEQKSAKPLSAKALQAKMLQEIAAQQEALRLETEKRALIAAEREQAMMAILSKLADKL